MKKAEQIYDEVYQEAIKHSQSFKAIAIEAMKVYAQQIADNALDRAADRVGDCYGGRVHDIEVLLP